MRISDWSSDVCSSDLRTPEDPDRARDKPCDEPDAELDPENHREVGKRPSVRRLDLPGSPVMRMEPDLGGAKDMGQGLLTRKKGLIVSIGRQIDVRLDQYVPGVQVERSKESRYRVERNVFRNI